MKRITVFGCGLVGGLIVRDLASDPDVEVRAVDRSDAPLRSLAGLPRVETRTADVSNDEVLRALIADADAVVGAVPGHLGFSMLRRVIDAGKPIADISFSPENFLALDETARARGVTAVVDCGVSPGLSNLAIGRAASKLAHVRTATIYVGGLPEPRFWPFEYRSVFSPTDVVEEYTRPARLVEAGRIVTKEALTEVELVDIPGVGTLEAFNSDGLRTLLHTVKADFMKEKTMRYPGHADRMRMLRTMGLFSSEPVTVDGQSVVPRRLTESLMFKLWNRPSDEAELTALRVIVEGEDTAKTVRRYTYDLLDRTDRTTGATSMARTTGFPCAIAARMLARGSYVQPGIQPLENLAVRDDLYDAFVAGLLARGVKLVETSSLP